MQGTDVRIRWLLEIADQGGPDRLLKQDRELRSSLQQTDTQYRRTSATATSVSARQEQAAKDVAAATGKQAKATDAVRVSVDDLNRVQAQALSVGARAIAQAKELAAAKDRDAKASDAAAAAEGRLARARRDAVAVGRNVGRRASGAGSRVGGAIETGIGGVASAAGTVLKGGALGVGLVGGAATDLTVKGLHLGTEIRAGAAGIGGLTGLNPRDATALALIAHAEDVSARGLTTAFATLGKQATGFLGPKAPKATIEGFKALGLTQADVRANRNNLPGLFDQVYSRGQKLPAAERASVLKTFLGRGAALGGQIELGGPLQKQIRDVAGGLQGIDPKKLADLHETEVKLHEETDALELSFASTFGPGLIKLMGLVAPAIKPIGAALHTAVAVPLGIAKELIPGVFRGLKAGITGHGVSIENAAGPGHTRRLVAGAGERPHAKESTLEKIGGTVGSAVRTIGVAAAKYGSQLLDAFKPAIPFFQNVLLPLVKGVGLGLLGAVAGAIPVIKIFATVLGAIGTFLKPLKGVFELTGKVIGIVFAGSILKVLEALPKVGIVFRLLGAPIKLVAGVFEKLGGVFTAVGGLAGRAAGMFGRLPGVLGKVVGGTVGAASRLVGGVGGTIGKLGGKVVGAVAEAGSLLFGRISGWAGGAIKAAGHVVSSIINVFKSLGGKVAGAVGEGVKAAFGAVGDVLKGLAPSFDVGGFPFHPHFHMSIGGQQVFRKGGRAYAAGGMVPARVSPGEQILYGGASMIVPGSPTAADSVGMMLPVGAAVLTYDGQARMAAGQNLAGVLDTQAPHFAKGGLVVSGPVSTFGPPGEAAGSTAYGGSSSQAGIALNPHGGSNWNDTLARSLAGKLFDVEVAGHHARLKVIDKGPSAIGKHGPRLIDITGAGARQMGLNPAAFPTDSTGRATPAGGSAAGASALSRMIRAGRREGLIEDAVAQGIEAGAAGGRDRAFLTSISEAVGTVSKTSGGKGKTPAGLTTPSATWNPARKEIARWIVPYLSYGAGHGWSGSVTSGYRSKAEQARIYNSGVRPAAKPGTSHHEGTQYPSGAVDVTAASTLAGVLSKESGPHLLSWAGSKDPVHFSHPFGGGYRRGGVIGGNVGRQLPQLSSSAGSGSFTGILGKLDTSLAAATDARLSKLRSELVAGASRGGPAGVVKAYQAVVSLIDYQLGRRIGAIGQSIEQRSSALARGSSALDRSLRSRGIDAASSTGLRLASQNDKKEEQARQRSVSEAKDALHKAHRTGNKNAIKEAGERLTQAEEELDESVTKHIEDNRAALRQSAQDAVDATSYGVQSAQGSLSQLDTAQRINRTSETAGGLSQKASVINSTLIPALGANLAALNSQLGVLQATGASPQEIQQEMLAIQSAGSEIGSAMAEAAEDIRAAAEKAAEELTEGAEQRTSFAQLGLAHEELEERINGSFEGGGQNRAAYIQTQIVPAIEAEIAAIKHEEEVDRGQGDIKKAEEKRQLVAERANDLLSAIATSNEDIRANTDARPGGSLGFTNDGESINDVLAAAGTGL